jgi:hypothetical protein
LSLKSEVPEDELFAIRSPAVVLKSRSNAFPVGAMTVPSGWIISPVRVPVVRQTTVIQSPLPNWIGYGWL